MNIERVVNYSAVPDTDFARSESSIWTMQHRLICMGKHQKSRLETNAAIFQRVLFLFVEAVGRLYLLLIYLLINRHQDNATIKT